MGQREFGAFGGDYDINYRDTEKKALFRTSYNLYLELDTAQIWVSILNGFWHVLQFIFMVNQLIHPF